MASTNEIRFKLRPKQKLFVENQHRWSFYVGGLGAGKTYAGAVRSIYYALQYPGSFGLIGAPTYPMLRDTTQRTFFELLPPQLVAGYNKNEAKLYLTNGTEILFRSMDQPDRCRGLNLMWFWMDEAPFCGYYAWKVLKARAGRQDPKKFPPFGWATGTPKGKDGYYEDFEHKPQKEHFLVRASTFENSVNLPEGYVDSLGYDGTFALQEIEGQFTAFEGLVYQFASETGNPDSNMMPPGMIFKLPSGRYLRDGKRDWETIDEEDIPDDAKVVTVAKMIGGVDWGYNNPAAIVVLAVDSDERIYMLSEWYRRKASLQHVFIPAIVEQARKFEIEYLYCDPAEPENILDLRHEMDLQEQPTVVKAGDNAIAAGIQTVIRYVALRGDGARGFQVHATRCPNTVKEFGSYQYPQQNAEGTYKAEELKRNPAEIPEDKNNHALGAIRYALHTCFGVGRQAEIAQASGRRNDPSDGSSVDEAERAFLDQEANEIAVLRGRAAAQFLRNLEKQSLVHDERFRPW